MDSNPPGLTGRKILAAAAADRASRDFLEAYNELVDNASIVNLLTVKTRHNSIGLFKAEFEYLDYDSDISAPELRKLALARYEARMARKAARRRRYIRRHKQWEIAVDTGITGIRGHLIVLDDIHE